MLASLFKARPARARGQALYRAVIAQARTPELYRTLGAPDTYEGRFELYVLHLALVLRRLKRQGSEAEEVSQATFDAFVSGLDAGLREMGVGDISVGRKMRKLGEAAYGRFKGYDEALAVDDGTLAAMLRRTVFAGDEAAEVMGLAEYARAADAALGDTPLAAVIDGELRWPAIPS